MARTKKNKSMNKININGKEYEVDCIIYASGFEVGTPFERRAGYDITGRDGVKLSDAWADGMVTKHGTHVHGFPNAFIVQVAQGANLISNVPHNFTEAGVTVAAIGLIVPPLTGMLPILAPIAAVGLVLVQVGAIIVHVMRNETKALGMNVVLLLLAAFVAVGRFLGF